MENQSLSNHVKCPLLKKLCSPREGAPRHRSCLKSLATLPGRSRIYCHYRSSIPSISPDLGQTESTSSTVGRTPPGIPLQDLVQTWQNQCSRRRIITTT